MLWPLLAALVLTGIHVYLGLHVVTRGVIFVDLALAQVAALGMAIGVLLGWEVDSIQMYFLALGFTFLGAILFAYTRSLTRSVSQEAIIGIVYAVSAALMIILFSKSAEGADHLNHLLVGSILFVTPGIVFQTLLLYSAIGIFHWVYRRQFMLSSEISGASDHQKVNLKVWDFLFYMTFGFVVTSSVKIAGVFLVFSFLIIPATAALIFVRGVRNRLFFGWAFGFVGSLLGMVFSVMLDIPTGASIVATFGVLLIITGVVKGLWVYGNK
ncbi:MAG: metal ABC transporter permease [Candidatus Marinimicrobia bacterium]|nr:metal ABC transporter permease [Candidatus Neomarinimicrobiota bacterium]